MTIPPYPKLVDEGVVRFTREGKRSINWCWMWASQQERDEVDRVLVERQHLLVFQAEMLE